MQTADFYSSATGTLRVNGGRDENAPKGVSLSVDDLSYIKQGSRANEAEAVTDYDLLDNKPQINNVTLTGNKSLNDLGIQSKIDSSHKISADNIDDTGTTNKFATAAQLAQIQTNQNNILTLQQKSTQVLPSGGKEYLEISLVSDSTNNRGIFLLSIPYQSAIYASCLYMITVGVGTGISGTGIVAYTRIDTQESPDVIAVTISADKKKLYFQVQANSWAQPVIIPMFNPENQPTITANWRDSLPT